MKKLLSLVLVLVLTVAMTVTAYAQTDAYALYNEMNQAVSKAQAMECDYTMAMEMRMMGESISMTIDGSLEQLIKSGTDAEMAMTMNMRLPASLGGGAQSATVYFVDGYMYQEQLGERYKIKMDVSQVMEQAGLEMMDSEFSLEDFTTMEAAPAEGGTLITAVISSEKINQLVNTIMAGQASTMGVSDMKMTLGEISYTILVGDNKLPVRQTMQITMEMELLGETVEVSVDMVMDYVGFNHFWAIAYPDWLGNCLEY